MRPLSERNSRVEVGGEQTSQGVHERNCLTMGQPRKLITTDEAATLMGVTPRTFTSRASKARLSFYDRTSEGKKLWSLVEVRSMVKAATKPPPRRSLLSGGIKFPDTHYTFPSTYEE